MKYTVKGALGSAPKFLTALLLSTFLVACGGGTSGDETTAGDNTGLDTDLDLDSDLDLDPDADTDDGFIDGANDLDSDGNGVSDADELELCWAADGVRGTDETSANYLWNDNCHISAANPFSTSTYAQGIQRVLYCSGVGGVASSTAAFADGIFGPATAQAVRDFQTAENAESIRLADGRAVLAVDGIVGPNTWDRLQARVLNLDTDAFITAEQSLGVDSEILGVLAPTYESEGIAAVDCSNERNFIGLINAESQEIDGWRLTNTPGGTGVNTFSIDRP